MPIALALVIGGQPVGEIVCGVACESGPVAWQPAPRSHLHSCHDAADGATSEEQAAADRDDVRGHEYAGAPCRQSVASFGEDACVWAREICPTLVGQKTSIVPVMGAPLVLALLHPAPEIAATPPLSGMSRDVTLRLATALRI